MPERDIDELLRRTKPGIAMPSDLRSVMAETARSVAGGQQVRPIRRRPRRSVVLTAAAAALLVGGVVAPQMNSHQPTRSATPTPTSDPLRLLAASSAPSGLPLPAGVTIEDAKAFVTRLLASQPDLQASAAYALDRGTIVGHVKGQTANLPPQFQETGITAAYVFYAKCQWERTMLDRPAADYVKQEGGTMGLNPDDPGAAALLALGDPAAWSMDGHAAPVPLAHHEGITFSVVGADGVRSDFETNCTNGFGDAPAANR